MTVAIGFYCRDGVVIGADSMLTPSIGNLSVGHHKGEKVHLLDGGQVFSFAGDQGQAARFQIMANASHDLAGTAGHPIDYPLSLTESLIRQFSNTGIGGNIDVNILLGFTRLGTTHLCVFEGLLQPRLLDASHYYVALGIGKLSADPFLRFLVDIFCTTGPPSVSEATFLTAWTIQHVIDTNPGGVAGPIKLAVIEKDAVGNWASRLLTDNEIDDHGQAIGSALDALRFWRDSLAAPLSLGTSPPPEAPLRSQPPSP